MLRRLLETSWFSASFRGTYQTAAFWLRELRTPELLIDACRAYPQLAIGTARLRPAVAAALKGDPAEVEQALSEEEADERRDDRAYWEPLKKELEQFRRDRRAGS